MVRISPGPRGQAIHPDLGIHMSFVLDKGLGLGCIIQSSNLNHMQDTSYSWCLCIVAAISMINTLRKLAMCMTHISVICVLYIYIYIYIYIFCYIYMFILYISNREMVEAKCNDIHMSRFVRALPYLKKTLSHFKKALSYQRFFDWKHAKKHFRTYWSPRGLWMHLSTRDTGHAGHAGHGTRCAARRRWVTYKSWYIVVINLLSHDISLL